MTQQGLGELASLVGTQEYRINVQLPNANGKGWAREVNAVDTALCAELGPDFRVDLAYLTWSIKQVATTETLL